MLDFLIEYRADIYILLVAVGAVYILNLYAANLACAQYIKSMVDRFLAHQDRAAEQGGEAPVGTRKQRAKTMEKRIRKQAKLARKANRGK